jgi:orotidine-5'-phosphate decarboxylase
MNKKIIVAIDLSNLNKAIQLVKNLKKEAFAFKIGHEFFYNFGIEGYKKIYKICPRIFLDLKLHDIPNTVEKGIKAILRLKPIFTTIHISGGDEMQKKSIINNKKTKILGVTVLTSLNQKQTLKYYKEKNINLMVKKFSKYAKENKLSGLVCSPLEIKTVRKAVGKEMVLIVPGIRPEDNIQKSNDDQKRILNPKEAIKLGADYLVIGRPIVESKNPLETIKKINKSIQ